MKVNCYHYDKAPLIMRKNRIGFDKNAIKPLSLAHKIILLNMMLLNHAITYDAPERYKNVLYERLKQTMSKHRTWYRFLKAVKKNNLIFVNRKNGILYYELLVQVK